MKHNRKLRLQISFVGTHANAGVFIIRLEVLPGPRVANVVKLRNNGSEENESCSCSKHSSSQHLTRGRSISKQCSVLGVICIPCRTRQQADLRYEEKHPEIDFVAVENITRIEKPPLISTRIQCWNTLVCFTYQQMMKRTRAQAREPPGLRGLPQQKQRLTTIMRIWLAIRKRNAPTPNPVEMSESYTQ